VTIVGSVIVCHVAQSAPCSPSPSSRPSLTVSGVVRQPGVSRCVPPAWDTPNPVCPGVYLALKEPTHRNTGVPWGSSDSSVSRSLGTHLTGHTTRDTPGTHLTVELTRDELAAEAGERRRACLCASWELAAVGRCVCPESREGEDLAQRLQAVALIVGAKGAEAPVPAHVPPGLVATCSGHEGARKGSDRLTYLGSASTRETGRETRAMAKWGSTFKNRGGGSPCGGRLARETHPSRPDPGSPMVPGCSP
jgi:hypothetical protein